MKKWFLSSLVLFVSSASWAQMFSANEVALHKQNIQIVTSTAANCLNRTYADHVRFFQEHGVSKYYGNRKPEHQTRQGLIDALTKYGAPASLVSQLEPISCIGLTLKCLGEGFKAAGQESTWAKIHAQLAIGQKFYGTDLQKMLRQLGWKILYWNPNPAQNAQWDAEDRAINPVKEGRDWNPVWGGHAYHYAMVMSKGTYYGVPVDDAKTMVNFGDVMPPAFRKVPFFVGTAHAGYHVFPGHQGRIIEAHSMRNLNAFDNLEISDFNPFAPGGGPRWTRSEKYRSGVIAVPPVP